MLRVPGRKILVKRDVEGEKTDGGILRPEAARRVLPRGTIAVVGDELQKEGKPKVGDRVFFPNEVAWDVEIEGEKYAALHFEEVTAWIPGEEVQEEASSLS